MGVWKSFQTSASEDHLYQILSKNWEFSHTKGLDGLSGISLFAHPSAPKELCKEIADQLNYGCYEFTGYKALSLDKGIGKLPRTLSLPTLRDRVALKFISEFLYSEYPKYKTTSPRVVIKDIKRLYQQERFRAFLKLDIQHFYDSIDLSLLEQDLHKQRFPQKIQKMLLAACAQGTVEDGTSAKIKSPKMVGVPQGISISNFLGELFMKPIERELIHACRSQHENIKVIRYVDDILILGTPRGVKLASQYSHVIFSKHHLKLHALTECNGKSSMGYCSDEFQFLGYLFTPAAISIRQSSISKLEASLARSCTRYKYSDHQLTKAQPIPTSLWYLNLTITGCMAHGQRRGWLEYFSQMTDIRLLRRLDNKVKSLKKRVNIDLKSPSFISVYRELHTSPDHWSTIPNFDTYSEEDKRELLAQLFPERRVLTPNGQRVLVSKLSGDLLDHYFDNWLSRTTKSLEADILNIS